MGKTLIVGAVDRYTYDDIKIWLRSIKKNAPACKTALIVYNMSNKDADRLTEEGLDYIFAFEKNNQGDLSYASDGKPFSIVVERFAHLWHFLSQVKDFEYVVCTDVKDVIFQADPTTFLENSTSIVVGAEWLKYCDEPWNKQNMTLAFGPMMYQQVYNRPIICAGVIAGRRQAIADLCLNIFLLCRGTNAFVEGGGGPDQAALNILLSMQTYDLETDALTPTDGFVYHLGTSRQAVLDGSGGIGQAYKQNPKVLDDYDANALYPQYKIENDQIAISGMQPAFIVHQWDRCRDTFELVKRLYGE